MKTLSEIKKEYLFCYRNHEVKIIRNYRGDNFLQPIIDNNNPYISKIFPPQTYFFTLKKAKETAIKLIDNNFQ